MLFYSIGEALQERAVERARRNIRALVDIRPEQANVLVEGKPVAMPAAQVVPGRTIEVLPGDVSSGRRFAVRGGPVQYGGADRREYAADDL